MNEVINNIITRRSIRFFINKKISREDLETIASSAIYAPSARDSQTWNFTVIQNRSAIIRLASVVAVEIKQDYYDFYSPDALIIASNNRNSVFGALDCACALENIFLTAHSLGIGSVWLNQLYGLSDIPAVRSMLAEFGIPQDHVVCGVAALGYADGVQAAPFKNKNNIRYIF